MELLSQLMWSSTANLGGWHPKTKAHLDEPLLPAEAPWNVFMSKATGVLMVKSRAYEICKVYGRNEAALVEAKLAQTEKGSGFE